MKQKHKLSSKKKKIFPKKLIETTESLELINKKAGSEFLYSLWAKKEQNFRKIKETIYYIKEYRIPYDEELIDRLISICKIGSIKSRNHIARAIYMLAKINKRKTDLLNKMKKELFSPELIKQDMAIRVLTIFAKKNSKEALELLFKAMNKNIQLELIKESLREIKEYNFKRIITKNTKELLLHKDRDVRYTALQVLKDKKESY